MNKRKLLRKILSGSKNIRFEELTALVEAFGFQLARVTGGHHIYEHQSIQEIVNLQNYKGKAKPYQVRQFLELVEQHNLTIGDDE